LAAGVVALILSAHPDLTWVEVQYVVKEASWKHMDDPSWRENAVGVWHSNKFGFGLLDSERAVKAAQRWKNEKIRVFEKGITKINDVPITMDKTEGTSIIRIIERGHKLTAHHVEVKLWTSHHDVSTTAIKLISPAGTESRLAWEHGDKKSKWTGWRFLSRAFWGENIEGEWTLHVKDNTNDVTEDISKWELTIHGNDTIVELALPVPVTNKENVKSPEITTAPERPEISTPTINSPEPESKPIIPQSHKPDQKVDQLPEEKPKEIQNLIVFVVSMGFIFVVVAVLLLRRRRLQRTF